MRTSHTVTYTSMDVSDNLTISNADVVCIAEYRN